MRVMELYNSILQSFGETSVLDKAWETYILLHTGEKLNATQLSFVEMSIVNMIENAMKYSLLISSVIIKKNFLT